MGSYRVGHDWSDLAAVAAATIAENFTNLEQEIDIQAQEEQIPREDWPKKAQRHTVIKMSKIKDK